MNTKNSGYTLIEVLVAGAILTVTSSTAFATINPAQKLQEARNVKRSVDVQQIVTATELYIIDHKGEFPPGFPQVGEEVQIGSGSSCIIPPKDTFCNTPITTCYNLPGVVGTYLSELPTDPLPEKYTGTGYTIQRDENNRITVKACGTEDPKVIATSQ